MSGWIKNVINKIKDLNGSVDLYKQESVIQSLPTVACVNQAKKLIEEKKYDEAKEILNNALDISSQDSRVYKYLGKISEINGKFAEAIKYYMSSVVINPQDKEIWLRLGMSQLSCNQVDEALKSFEKGNKVTPFNTDILTGWGMALMKQKKYALARDKFIDAAKVNKYNFSAILLSAIMEVRLCDYESAEMKLAFLAKVAPNESSNYEYANLKLLKADYKAAETYAKKAIEINRQMLPAYFVLGEVYSRDGDIINTERVFNSAISYDLENEVLYCKWGEAYIRFFEFKKANEKFAKALEFSPDYPEAKIGLALTKALGGDFTHVDELKERHGDNVYMQEAIGLQMWAKGKKEDAAEMFKKALRTDSRQSFNLLHLARLYEQLNNKTKTREYYEKFVVIHKEYLPALVEFSRWLISIGDIADAQRKLRKAERLDKNNIEVLNMLFFTSYRLVKDNVCEYNIKEAISLAQKIQSLGEFKYENEKAELEQILINIQGNN